MRRLLVLGLSLAAILLVASAHSAAAKAPVKIKPTIGPIATLAMDASRVAYVSGGKVYAWNVSTGASSVVKGTYSKYPGEVAIAGKRVAWITRYVVGNSYQTTERLYTAPLAGQARQLRLARRYAGGETGDEWHGGWIAGAVGSGNVLAVSTWTSNGPDCTAQRLSVVTPAGLRQIVSGPGAIVAASADGGRIAVLRSQEAWRTYAAAPPIPAASVGIYSASGKLLREIVPSSAEEIALSGGRLVVLTEAKTLEVYDRQTGALVHAWPIAASTPKLQAGHLAVYGRLAVYSVDPRYSAARRLHVLNLTTGKDVVIATARGSGYYSRDAAIGPRGLVYAVTYSERDWFGQLHPHGRLVFVPLASVNARVS
jgi:hypothetical protein